MEETVIRILAVFIPSVVTIIGFIVTYFLNQRNLKEEINKQKSNIYLAKIADMPFEIITLIDHILDMKDFDVVPTFKEIISSVFAYGSKEAILIMANMQELAYSVSPDSNKTDRYRQIAYYILLVCQIKYDLTGIKINPEYWYRIRIKDYIAMKSHLHVINNDIVENLNLEVFLRI